MENSETKKIVEHSEAEVERIARDWKKNEDNQLAVYSDSSAMVEQFAEEKLMDDEMLRRVIGQLAERSALDGTLEQVTAKTIFTRVSEHLKISPLHITQNLNVKKHIKELGRQLVLEFAEKLEKEKTKKHVDSGTGPAKIESKQSELANNERVPQPNGERLRASEKGRLAKKRKNPGTIKGTAKRTARGRVKGTAKGTANESSNSASDHDEAFDDESAEEEEEHEPPSKRKKKEKENAKKSKLKNVEDAVGFKRYTALVKALRLGVIFYKGLPSKENPTHRAKAMKNKLLDLVRVKKIPAASGGLPTLAQASKWREEEDNREELKNLVLDQTLTETRKRRVRNFIVPALTVHPKDAEINRGSDESEDSSSEESSSSGSQYDSAESDVADDSEQEEENEEEDES